MSLSAAFVLAVAIHFDFEPESIHRLLLEPSQSQLIHSFFLGFKLNISKIAFSWLLVCGVPSLSKFYARRGQTNMWCFSHRIFFLQILFHALNERSDAGARLACARRTPESNEICSAEVISLLHSRSSSNIGLIIGNVHWSFSRALPSCSPITLFASAYIRDLQLGVWNADDKQNLHCKSLQSYLYEQLVHILIPHVIASQISLWHLRHVFGTPTYVELTLILSWRISDRLFAWQRTGLTPWAVGLKEF